MKDSEGKVTFTRVWNYQDDLAYDYPPLSEDEVYKEYNQQPDKIADAEVLDVRAMANDDVVVANEVVDEVVANEVFDEVAVNEVDQNEVVADAVVNDVVDEVTDNVVENVDDMDVDG